MFARIFALVPFVLLASAYHLKARDSCNDGSIECCNTESYNNAVDKYGLEEVLLAIAADTTASLGVTCLPISVVGVSGNSCTQQTVCCTKNNFNGVVNVACNPINVSV